MKELSFLDGRKLLQAIPLRSLVYGEGVFETFRWKRGPPVFLKRHIARMELGARFLGVPFPGSRSIKTKLFRATEDCQNKDISVKVCLLSSGPMKFSKLPAGSHILIVLRDYESSKPGVRVHVSSTNRNSSSKLSPFKSLNYLENVIARREAELLGFDEFVFVNERGELAEGATTNIFWGRRGALYTPELSCGLLPGITRELLMTSAEEIGLKVVEGRYRLRALLRSKGSYLTNSLMGISQITEVDGAKLASGGPLYMALKDSLLEKLGWLD